MKFFTNEQFTTVIVAAINSKRDIVFDRANVVDVFNNVADVIKRTTQAMIDADKLAINYLQGSPQETGAIPTNPEPSLPQSAIQAVQTSEAPAEQNHQLKIDQCQPFLRDLTGREQ